MSLHGPDPRERPGGEAPPAAKGALRRWAPPAAALVVIVGFAVAVWSAYRPHADGSPGVEPPLVRADDRPVKSRPDDPGGWKAPHQDKLVYEVMQPGPPAPEAERLLPGPEQPMAKPVPPPKPAVVEQAPPAQPPAAPVIVAEAAPAPPPVAEPPQAAPPPAAQAETPATAAAPTETLPPPTVAAPPIVAAPAPSIAVAPPPVAPTSVPPTPAEQVAALPASGAFRLQLAAFQDRAQAEAVWRRLKRAHPAVLEGLQPQVVAADLGAKGTWYRLQAAGLGSEAAARAACTLLKSQKQDCLVIKPG